MSHDGCKVLELPNELGRKSWGLVKRAAMSVHLVTSARVPENAPLATVRPHYILQPQSYSS